MDGYNGKWMDGLIDRQTDEPNSCLCREMSLISNESQANTD